MKLTFRWYGDNDPVTLDHIRQIPTMSGIVSAVYDVPAGGVWSEESIAALAPQIALACNPCPVRSLAIPNIPVAQGTVAQQRERFGFNREKIKAILAELEEL